MNHINSLIFVYCFIYKPRNHKILPHGNYPLYTLFKMASKRGWPLYKALGPSIFPPRVVAINHKPLFAGIQPSAQGEPSWLAQQEAAGEERHLQAAEDHGVVQEGAHQASAGQSRALDMGHSRVEQDSFGTIRRVSWRTPLERCPEFKDSFETIREVSWRNH